MVSMEVIFDGDNCWPDLSEMEVVVATAPIRMAALRGGMVSGKPSVTVRVDLPDGSVVLAETTMVLLMGALRLFKAEFGEEGED